MARSNNLEEKLKAFGQGFYGLYVENHISSVVHYPERGPWGDSGFRGNCSGHLVKDLILRFGCRSVFDPAEGSGTVRDVVDGINRYLGRQIEYQGRDLRNGWDVLTSELPGQRFDFIWYHPPYWDIIRYSDSPGDLSNCKSLQDFEDKLNRSVKRLFHVLRPKGVLAVLIGDKRKGGNYYALARTLFMNEDIGRLKAVIIKVQHNCRSDGKEYRAGNRFLIPIKHEYCLVFQKT